MVYSFSAKNTIFKATMAQLSRTLKTFLQVCLILSLHYAPVAQAREASIIIRDAEIENTLKEWIRPLLKSAGVDSQSVKIVIVQNPQINAFVAGGMNIFVYTGLIEKTENPGELIGVLAHELGHIAGGHLVATRGAFERASYESILGTVLGIGAAIATGNGQAASAIISGSQSLATSRFLSHSRVQESAADQAALRFMQGAGYNPAGLKSFFEKLESEELLPASQQSAYMRTHPLTQQRIEAVETKAGESPYSGKDFPPKWIDQHKRIKAKLTAFISPGQVPWSYSDGDASMPARYARAIAAYRQNDVAKALKETDALIATEPSNPYFLELKGQMLVDFARVSESLPYYQKAIDILPDSGLIRMALGHAMLESAKDEQSLRKSIQHLERALQDEPRSAKAHHLLATAYGRLGNEDRAKLELAEEAILQRRLSDAEDHARAVAKTAAKGSHEAVLAKDILKQVESLKKQRDTDD